MDDKQIAEIEARAEAATPGPWRHFPSGFTVTGYCDGEKYYEVETGEGTFDGLLLEPTANFLANSRTDIPALIAEVRRLRTVMEKYATSYGNNHALAQMTIYGRLLTPRELDEKLKGGE